MDKFKICRSSPSHDIDGDVMYTICTMYSEIYD